MEIIIHVESKKLDKNLQLAVNEYVKRTSPYCKVNIKLYKSMDKASFKSGSKLYRIIPGSNSPTSEGLAQIIEQHNLSGISCIEFIVLNLDKKLQSNEHDKHETIEEFHLSSFAMDIDLTAVVLTEQIYRAYTIMNNITYHK